MAAAGQGFGMGWLPDLPDFRDFSLEKDEVTEERTAEGVEKSVKAMLRIVVADLSATLGVAGKVDLRNWYSPIEDRETICSCTVQVGVGILEYFERRAHGKHIDASRLFLYNDTRNLVHLTGDTEAHLKTTMGAMVLLRVPPEGLSCIILPVPEPPGYQGGPLTF